MDGVVPLLFLIILLSGFITCTATIVLGGISIRRTFSTAKAFNISFINLFIVAIAFMLSFFVRKTAIGSAPMLVFGVIFVISAALTYRIAKRSNIQWYK